MDEIAENWNRKMSTCLVSGKFKVLHLGHLRLFKTAASLADKLIIAIDSSGVSKEELNWRIKLISNIDLVQEVIEFNGDVEGLINDLKPDFVVKGSEFSRAFNIEDSLLKNYGGKLVFSSGNYAYLESKPGINFLDTIVQDSEFLSRNSITRETIQKTINKFVNLKVCVIGDLIIDKYIDCKAVGMSQENPGVVFTPSSTEIFIGGAGIVAQHCNALGAKTDFFSILGNDEMGKWVKSKFLETDIDANLFIDDKRKTTIKTRYKFGLQNLFRLSEFTNDTITLDFENKIVKEFEKNCKNYDLLIFSDFSYGLLSPELVCKILEICKLNSIFVAADSQSSSQIGDLSKFCDIDLVTPTEREARVELKDETSGLAVLLEKLQDKIRYKNVILKLAGDGVLIYSHQNSLENFLNIDQILALNQNPVNISGAGDALLASSSLALASGADIYESSYIGSMAAALHISHDSNKPLSLIDFRDLVSLL